ncbi:MAG: hypothetical protein WCL07_01340 [bacterium]
MIQSLSVIDETPIQTQPELLSPQETHLPESKLKLNVIVKIFAILILVGLIIFNIQQLSRSTTQPEPNHSELANLLAPLSPSPSPLPSISTKPFSIITPTPSPTPTPPPSSTPSISYSPKVFVLIFDPTYQNSSIINYLHYNQPQSLDSEYIRTIKEVSKQTINYQIVKTQVVNSFPVKLSGYTFNSEEYVACLNNQSCNRELIDYQKLINDYNLCQQANNGEFQEVWLWGGPWMGFLEAVTAGPNDIYTNGEPIANSSCAKTLHIMGFSYERGVSEMIENLGHRIEGTMRYISGITGNQDWYKFVSYDQANPNQAECGFVHYAPNSTSDYDWSNSRTVNSNCESWKNYPDVVSDPQPISCSKWSCDGFGYKKWWLSHLPANAGSNNNIFNNWWTYITY